MLSAHAHHAQLSGLDDVCKIDRFAQTEFLVLRNDVLGDIRRVEAVSAVPRRGSHTSASTHDDGLVTVLQVHVTSKLS